MIPPRPELAALTEAVHGAIDAAELAALGIDPRTVLDFSASINPLGPSPRVIAAVQQAAFDTYPDRDCTQLRAALAAHLDVTTDCLLAGNGSSELLHLLAFAYLRTSDTALVVGPTYSEYARVAKLMGTQVIACDSAASEFALPTSAVHDALVRYQPRAAFLCHPNNPTGTSLDVAALESWLAEFPQTLFIVDEAYIEFAPAASSVVNPQHENLLVLRSLTKAHGLAGLRVGYAVAHPEIIATLARVRPPWSVSAVAQAAAVAALADLGYVQQAVTTLLAEKQRLVSELHALGLATVPSAAHYFLIRVASAAHVRRQLLAAGLLVRDCTSFGLPEFIRISPRTPADNNALLAAFGALK
jgi:threonine-phosphate decarboxylase